MAFSKKYEKIGSPQTASTVTQGPYNVALGLLINPKKELGNLVADYIEGAAAVIAAISPKETGSGPVSPSNAQSKRELMPLLLPNKKASPTPDPH